MLLEKSRVSVDLSRLGMENPVFEDEKIVSLTAYRDGPSTVDALEKGNPDIPITPSPPQTASFFKGLSQDRSLQLEFKDLSFQIPVKKYGRKVGSKSILDRVNGVFYPGELAAIMGPSGAGKSTLMNVLAGYKTTGVSGVVIVNGEERNRVKFRKSSCYIMQDDCMSQHLTVMESMQVSAELKLSPKVPRKDKLLIINQILELLGLSSSENTFTSNLSGGQRKRLAIALELVNNPPVMFFDEPTSGLDSSSCYHVVSLLRELAHEGRTIVCTVHQPSARLFEMFDRLYVLTDGQCMFEGPPNQVIPFLGMFDLHCPGYHNPADYVMEIAIGEHGDHSNRLVKYMRTKSAPEIDSVSEKGANVIPGLLSVDLLQGKLSPRSFNKGDELHQDVTGFPTSFWKQFTVLLRRTFVSILRDRLLTGLRALSHITVSILIGMLFWNTGNNASKVFNNAGCLFFNILFLLFTAMLPTILTFPLERNIFLREHLNYWYSLKSYYLAKTVADFPFQLLFPVLYISIAYFMTGQPLEPRRFFEVLLMGVMTALVSQSIGLIIGAGANVETAVFLGPVTSIPVLLFSGFFVTFNSIPYYLKWLSYVSYVRFAFEGTMLATFGHNRTNLYCDNFFCLFENPAEFLIELDINEEEVNYPIDFGALVALFLILRIAGYFVLRYRLRSNR